MSIRDAVVVPIWPPNWSQAFPDFLNALVTGIAVAAVVLLIDRARNRREIKTRSQDSWERLKAQLRPRVRYAVDRQEFLAIGPGLKVPDWMTDLAEYVTAFPLPDWEKVIDDPAVAALARLERTTAILRQLCADYTSSVSGVAFETVTRGVGNPNPNGWTNHVSVLEQLARGTVLGLPKPDVNWPAYGQLGGPARANELVALFRSNPRIASEVTRISAQLAAWESDYSQVQSAVIPWPRQA